MRPKTTPPPPRTTGLKMYLFLLFLFTLGASGVFIFINRDNMQEYLQTQKKRDAARTEIAQMQERIALLRRKQQSLELNGVEADKQFRERLNLHKLGEQVVFFEEEESQSTATENNGAIRPTTTTRQNQ